MTTYEQRRLYEGGAEIPADSQIASSNLVSPAPQGRRHAQGSQYRRAHPIFAAVPVLTIGLIWRSTNQEAFAN
jgi:hypothetical protein